MTRFLELWAYQWRKDLQQTHYIGESNITRKGKAPWELVEVVWEMGDREAYRDSLRRVVLSSYVTRNGRLVDSMVNHIPGSFPQPHCGNNTGMSPSLCYL